MAPESQTLFSITLFLALSSLLAWKNRRSREVHPAGKGATVAPIRATRQ